MNNIVFIEGVSGVGKTTITMSLSDKLREMGYESECYLEGANDNPLDPFNGTYPPPMSLTTFSETYMQCWRDFAENQLKRDFILILDGTFLHHQTNDLIRDYNASYDVIENHLSNLLHIIQHLNPIIFYLLSSDVGLRVIQARKSRNQSTPTEERITLWENRKRVDLYILERLLVESHILNIDGGWNSILEAMTMRML